MQLTSNQSIHVFAVLIRAKEARALDTVDNCLANV